MLSEAVLASLLRSCAPSVGPRTMAAIVRVESGRETNAIHDNTSGRSYAPAERAAAVRLAKALVARGHSLDLGLSQVNSANLPGLGLEVPALFDACTNLAAGARILRGAYRNAHAHFADEQIALRRALGAYNTGSLYAGARYIATVVAAAGVVDVEPAPSPVVHARPARAVRPSVSPAQAPIIVLSFDPPRVAP